MMTIAPHNPSVSLDNITDLDAAMRVCEYLALSDIVPAALRGKAANIFVVYLTGRELGLSFAQALRSIYVPSGGQPQLRGSLLLAKIIEAGHKYVWEYSEDGNSCTFTITRHDWSTPMSESFGLEDALLAGLVRTAPNGDIVAYSQGNRPLPWMQYRHDMLFWRAVARCANRVVPELVLGFEIAGSGEVQQEPVTPQPATEAGQQSVAEAGPPASDPSAELAGLDARGSGVPQGSAQEGEPESTPPPVRPVDPPAGPAVTTAGERATAAGPAGDGNPRASKQALKKLGDSFAALGWTLQENKHQIMNACTVYCKRTIVLVSDLSNREATNLATELGKIMRNLKDGDPQVALSDAMDGWEHDWEHDDPAAYEDYRSGL